MVNCRRGSALTVLLAMLMTMLGAAVSMAADPSSVDDGLMGHHRRLTAEQAHAGATTCAARLAGWGRDARRADWLRAPARHCGDEVMLPVEKLDAERIMAPLGPYNPKGRGPVALAARGGCRWPGCPAGAAWC
jgi:hypothetical protein